MQRRFLFFIDRKIYGLTCTLQPRDAILWSNGNFIYLEMVCSSTTCKFHIALAKWAGAQLGFWKHSGKRTGGLERCPLILFFYITLCYSSVGLDPTEAAADGGRGGFGLCKLLESPTALKSRSLDHRGQAVK